jgi:hypothetical protein
MIDFLIVLSLFSARRRLRPTARECAVLLVMRQDINIGRELKRG